ncbi:MAG: TetR/AcrR family transcriptional regulator [Candidatus Dormibacteria bacterium]
MTENLSLRSRKKLAARRALRSAAVRLVAARGLKNVTVEDIAAEADVSVRTFFNYFSSKEEAIVGPAPEVAAELRLALLGRPREELPLVALQAVLIDLAAPYADRQEDWLMHMQVVRQEPSLLPSMLASFAAQERSLVEAVAERTATDPDRDLYPALVAAVAIAAFRVAMTHWRTRKGERSLPHLVEAAMTRVQAGLPVAAPTRATTARMGSGRRVPDPGPSAGTSRSPVSARRRAARS